MIKLELKDAKVGKFVGLQGTYNLSANPNTTYEDLYVKECNKLFFFELRVFDFLYKSLG
jgi:hypothetical protein